MNETNNTLRVNNLDELKDAEKTIRFGEHLIVKKAENTTFIVKNDSKLTIEESRNCRFFHELNGIVELKNDHGSIKQDV